MLVVLDFQGIFGWSEDMENGKYGGKQHFLLFGSKEKIREREKENREENNPSEPTFFYPPNLRGKWKEKSVE